MADAVEDRPNVPGFGTMDEPSNGFVGVEDVREIRSPILHGHALSVFDGMRLGSGESLEAPGGDDDSRRSLNRERESAYKSAELLDGWQRVGVFRVDEDAGERELPRPNHFALEPGATGFADRYPKPFHESVRDGGRAPRPELRRVRREPFVDPSDPYPAPPAHVASRGAGERQSFGWAPHSGTMR